MSKKLKRRIQQLCGLDKLSREEKVLRANEILNSVELKQAICHEILGTKFKDIEKAMLDALKERQLTPEQEEEFELRESHPEKYEEPEFDPELEFKINKKAADKPKNGPSAYGTYTREQVAELLAASNAPYEQPPMMTMPKNYPTYSREQVEELMREHYAYEIEEKKRKEERDKWDSQKTTGLGPKTGHRTKPTNSSKD